MLPFVCLFIYLPSLVVLSQFSHWASLILLIQNLFFPLWACVYVWYMSANKSDDLSLTPRTHKTYVHKGKLVCMF